MAVKDDLKLLDSMISDMSDMINMLKEMMENTVTSVYDLPLRLATDWQGVTEKEIEEKTDDQLDIWIQNQFTPEENEYYNSFMLTYDTVEKRREAILDIVKTINDYMDSVAEKEKLEKQATDAVEDYVKYLNSPEYRELKMKRLEQLKEQAEATEDLYQKNKLLEKIHAIEASWTMSFFFDRFNKLGDKEIKATVNSFFDKSKSSYIMGRAQTKLKSLGYKQNIIPFLFNIEEKLLPEEYLPFNNLFLFSVLRFLAYIDISSEVDTLYAQAILVNSMKFMGHKFENSEDEDAMCKFIQGYDDLFQDYIEKFTSDNTTSPLHPVRQQADKEADDKAKKVLIDKMTKLGIELPENPENVARGVLEEMLEDYIDKQTKKEVDPDKPKVMEALQLKPQYQEVEPDVVEAWDEEAASETAETSDDEVETVGEGVVTVSERSDGGEDFSVDVTGLKVSGMETDTSEEEANEDVPITYTELSATPVDHAESMEISDLAEALQQSLDNEEKPVTLTAGDIPEGGLFAVDADTGEAFSLEGFGNM